MDGTAPPSRRSRRSSWPLPQGRRPNIYGIIPTDVSKLNLGPRSALRAKGSFVTALYHESISQTRLRVSLEPHSLDSSRSLDLILPTVRNADSDVKSVIVEWRPDPPREVQVVQRLGSSNM